MTTCHNKFCYGVTDLARKFFTPFHVQNNTLIHTGHVMWGLNTQQAKDLLSNNPQQDPEDSKHKVDLFIQDLCKKGIDSIYDMRVVNADAISYLERSTEKCLQISDKRIN